MTVTKSEFTSYQKLVIALLVFLQFTIILDFMILSPLGAFLMPSLHINPAQFGMVVAAYAFSAGASGLLSAGFADLFDRKKLLLFFYCGFIAGTFLCGIATTYEFLLWARIITGLFGGVIGSIVFAISTDLFVPQLRGRVMGFLQTAFAASQVLGLPVGLFLTNHWGWHAPFMMIVGVSGVVGLVIIVYLKPINEHLMVTKKQNPFSHFIATLSNGRYVQAFATTALLSTGGFMIMPFSSAFSVNNLGISTHQLPFIYLVTGFTSIFTGPIIGKLSDSLGKLKVFLFGSSLSIVMVIIYTHLGITPLYLVCIVSVLMFVGIFSRMIPSSALMSQIPALESRGAFMAVSSAVQQISGGLASLLAGIIVSESSTGQIEHFDTLGYVVVLATVITCVMMYSIDRRIKNEKQNV